MIKSVFFQAALMALAVRCPLLLAPYFLACFVPRLQMRWLLGSPAEDSVLTLTLGGG